MINRFLMCLPTYLAVGEPNNPWMRPTVYPDIPKAYAQFFNFYKALTESGIVYLGPLAGNLQDQTYTANVGCTIGDTFVLANFTSKPRQGEEDAAGITAAQNGISFTNCPYKFEGEADLKLVSGNTYIGGYGIRSSDQAYSWMEDTYGVNIVKVKLADEWLYHLDGSVFVLNSRQVLVVTDALRKADVRRIEAVAEVIPVPKAYMYAGWTNSVLQGGTLLVSCKDPHILSELVQMPFKEFDISEFEKSGACLSCLVAKLPPLC